ncbi:16S rRNA (adenine(1518)-N(6)/adenine(1519)-N(6))-dimethyltransferase RsmA [[Mycoplasma] anseris]|uniref:Ribosomal RNA small subunit methyltransferase A n=1 Tax=[Mycoplasma] anseris TaxID=92400 RepID=A0A2Z4NDE5_9BACT|nr:16S rRNA (adenine(1518)-N(6)/adenine(1519)-N(6))-dimethyltransferase RsmA [[Mycoplasma] anseris]AWX69611.1 ribosomal RNA small subunit methyltransferase A [[Mycoplasma] anseris]
MKIRAKKCFGQNFLNNKSVILNIIKVADIENKNVIEIGPGHGALTFELLNKIKTLKAFEIDNELYNELTNKIKQENVVIKNQDFLEYDFNEEQNVVVIGNIPYNITSDILFHLIKYNHKIKKATLMVQKEVAERIIAKPSTKAYSKLTLSMNFVADCQLAFYVKANNFNPKPKVDSAIITLDFYKKLELEKNEFLNFIKLLFQFKRKTLVNNLKNIYNPEKIIKALEILGFDEKIRSESLSLEDTKNLYILLNQYE